MSSAVGVMLGAGVDTEAVTETEVEDPAGKVIEVSTDGLQLDANHATVMRMNTNRFVISPPSIQIIVSRFRPGATHSRGR
jgi:hypothetical protein